MFKLMIAVIVALQFCSSVHSHCAFHHHTWHKNMKFCSLPKTSLYTGDFNGDGRIDILCHDKEGRTWLSYAKTAGTFRKTDFYRPHGFCAGKHMQIHIGDFNGDGSSDVLCHNSRNGEKTIVYASQGGQEKGKPCSKTKDRAFSSKVWFHKMGWCYHTGSTLHVGDFNGDGRSDILCHDQQGTKWIAFATPTGQFKGNSWHKRMNWCTGKHAHIKIADFNGDGRDDMLCHTRHGDNYVSLADVKGAFSGTTWKGVHRWCGGGAEIIPGDFNGDGRSDVLCHHRGNGYKWISYSYRLRHFGKTDWHRNMGWCRHGGSKVFVGDLNGDGMDDMLCHDTHGRKWAYYAECS